LSLLENEQRRNFIIELTTPTETFRWTPSRARTRDGRIGLIVGGNFFQKENISAPAIDLSIEAVAPTDVSISVGNADAAKDDLVFDFGALRSPIVISRVKFDAAWNVSSVEIWFAGNVGRTWLDGEKVQIDCYRELGHGRGTGPRKSTTLMTSHTPPASVTIYS
jgi:hypothetical protein